VSPNLPAFLFRPGVYPYNPNRPIEGFRLGLREIGGGPVPIAVEKAPVDGLLGADGAGSSDWYLVKPQRPLRTGQVALEFDDDCRISGPLAPTPVRREAVYEVGPALPLPKTVGEPTQTRFGVGDQTCGLPRVDFQIRLEPALDAFPLLRFQAQGADGRPLSAGFSRYMPGLVQGSLLLACSTNLANPAYLRPGETSVTFVAEVLGGPPLPPVTMEVEADCAADAGCATPDAATDHRGFFDPPGPGPAVDLGAPPERPADDVARPPDAAPDAGQPATDAAIGSLAAEGCRCTAGRGQLGAGPWLPAAALVLTWGRRRRIASRRTAGRRGRCTPSAD
jgi:hypothetical protein